MHRSGFERFCDIIASMQTSLHESLQWVLTLMFFGAAGTMLVGTMV
jgi:hypothetical protein